MRDTLDWERWRENRHLLPARVRTAVKRGQVAQLSAITEFAPGMCEVYVRRLKPRPPRWRRPLILAGVALATTGGVLWVLVLVLQTLLAALAPAAVVLAVAWLIFRAIKGHAPGCKGLHCPGCKG